MYGAAIYKSAISSIFREGVLVFSVRVILPLRRNRMRMIRKKKKQSIRKIRMETIKR